MAGQAEDINGVLNPPAWSTAQRKGDCLCSNGDLVNLIKAHIDQGLENTIWKHTLLKLSHESWGGEGNSVLKAVQVVETVGDGNLGLVRAVLDAIRTSLTFVLVQPDRMKVPRNGGSPHLIQTQADDRLETGSLSRLGFYVQLTGVPPDIGKAHPGAESQFTNVVRRGCIAVSHRTLHIINAGAFIAGYHLDGLRTNVHRQQTRMGVYHNIHLCTFTTELATWSTGRSWANGS